MDFNQPEKIDVLVAFIGNKISPKIIRWQNKKYLIKKINLYYEEKVGNQPIHCFAVSDNHNNVFDIAYSPQTSHWELRNLHWQ